MRGDYGWAGAYRLERPLGRCDAGEIFVASRRSAPGFEKPVAVWRIPVSHHHTPRFLDAVIGEAKRAARLAHANIAHILDLAVDEAGCFVASELPPGIPLGALVRHAGPLSWPAVATIGRDAARALRHAHLRRDCDGHLLRLVHGRLCPGRIVVGETGGIVITGFGTSSAWISRSPYRAPESDRGEPIDGRVDVYALGRILEQCLDRHAALPALVRAIERATAPYQEHRYTAAELDEELTELLHRCSEHADARALGKLTATRRPVRWRPGKAAHR